MTRYRNVSAFVAILLILAMVGCSTSPIEYLNLAVGALEVVLPLIGPAAGIPPNVISSVESYLGATSDAISKATDILNGPGTSAEKTAQIVAAFAGIAEPIVPVQYQALANAVQQVALYVAKFLASLPPAAGATASQSDLAKLATIRNRAGAVHRAIRH
jgi:hypothetical protein